MQKWEEDMPINKPKFIFDNRVVSSGYVIAILANDDSRLYTNKNDPCDYLSESGQWVPIEDAKLFPNETTLAQALEREKHVEGHGTCVPIFMQTTITTVDTESFNEHLKQRKIAKALSKLDEEDKIVLGLMGGQE